MAGFKTLSLKNHSWYFEVIILGIISFILFFLFLGSRPLSIPDEGNYAEIIREMVETGNYITPYLNGIKFFEKPILLYWLGALAIKIGGVNIWAIRCVNATLAIIVSLMTYFTSKKLFDRETGLTASLILSTCILFFSLGHMLTTDMVVSTFITLTLFSFLLGISEINGFKRFLYFSSFAIFAALAVLAKGLIGIIFPTAIIGIWIVFTKEWHYLKNNHIPWCIFLFLLVALPWHLLVAFKNPEFFYLYFVEHHFLRFATKTVGHPQPFWYYIPVLFIGFYPWICFLPLSIREAVKNFFHKNANYQIDIFLLIWITFILLFFTIATSKLIAYILPAFPAMAMLTAKYLAPIFTRCQLQHNMMKNFFYLFLFSIVISLIILFFPYYWETNQIAQSILYSRIGASILFFGMGLSYVFSKGHHYFSAFLNTFFTMAVFLIVLLLSVPAFDGESIKPLTDIVASRITKHDEVIAYHHHFQDLSFYLKRKVNIVNSHKLFKYGMRYQPHHEWLLNETDFKKLWPSNHRIFAFMHKEEFNNIKDMYPNYSFYVLEKTNRNVLVSNQK